jgi:hypothetical protein
MNDEQMSVECSNGLTAELRALGAALRAAPPVALDDAAVRRTFRAARAQARRAAERRAAAPAFVRRASAWASAAALVVSVATLAWVALTRDATLVSEAPQAGAPSEPVVFQPLLYAPSFSPDRSYRVVRVRIPLSALALGQSAEPGVTIEADVLVGDDGLASGIRFDPEDTLLITASR